MGAPGRARLCGGLALGFALSLGAAWAQTPLPAPRPGAMAPSPAKPEARAAKIKADLNKPARDLFGHVRGPAPLATRSIGFYSKGCLAGGVALPVNGPTWQAMRLSRNRNWGHPELVDYIEAFAAEVPKVSGWNGILVGDMAQPRGGPMLTGHASHQLGLDVDVWLTPNPGRELSRDEREKMSALDMVRKDRLDVDPATWRPDTWKVIRLAAADPRVERVLVNAAIKKALCREATGNRSWLAKVRPYWGHDHHMHIRLACPKDSPGCRHQAPVSGAEECGSELAWWFSDEVLHPKPSKTPSKPRHQITLGELPPACAEVLVAQ